MLCSILLAYITSEYVLLMVKAVALGLLLEMVVLQGFIKVPVPVVIWDWIRLKDAQFWGE